MAEDIKAAAAAAYAAAADHFDALPFWERFGRRTVDRLGLRPGERVLDACCGTGASALPAARRVGPHGTVLGVDLSEPALALARAKARERGLSNVEFRVADVERVDLAPEHFDAVVCVFGVFFLPDMVAGVRRLWRLVRPGGRLAVTVWGPRLFEPATGEFWAAVGAERPDLVGGFHPWTRVTEPAALADLFTRAGAAAPAVVAEAGTHPLADPGDWWTVVLGTGYRATVARLDPEAVARVRAATVARVEARAIREVETNVVYAVAGKPSGARHIGPRP
ncbi:class I SAM-dependent methyltransferase [Phytohabitans sp. LJ34]|uniref:class I SAM-dependent methyltransferase n=1 Tax=Phytohabitans sp. LJ34 TaxID=3452217 RepID=UPI003F8BCBEF